MSTVGLAAFGFNFTIHDVRPSDMDEFSRIEDELWKEFHDGTLDDCIWNDPLIDGSDLAKVARYMVGLSPAENPIPPPCFNPNEEYRQAIREGDCSLAIRDLRAGMLALLAEMFIARCDEAGIPIDLDGTILDAATRFRHVC